MIADETVPRKNGLDVQPSRGGPFLTNRLNVSITGLESSAGMHYIPKWTELAITAAFIPAGFALLGLAAKHLPIFPAEEQLTFKEPEAAVSAAVLSYASD